MNLAHIISSIQTILRREGLKISERTLNFLLERDNCVEQLEGVISRIKSTDERHDLPDDTLPFYCFTINTEIGEVDIEKVIADVREIIHESGGITKVTTNVEGEIKISEGFLKKILQFTKKETLYFGVAGFETRKRDFDMMWYVSVSMAGVIEMAKEHFESSEA